MDYLIVNPAAGKAQDADYWLRQLDRVGVRPRRFDTTDASAFPALGDNDRLLAVGGDGTLQRLAALCAERNCALGILPAGTANDFARGLGIPLEPQAACRTVATGNIREFDLGRVGDQIFLNVAHAGLGAEVSVNVEQDHKRLWGRMSYVRTLVERIENRRGFKATISCADRTIRARWLEIAVANGSTFGGGHRIFEASPSDGQLDIVAVRPHSLIRLFALWLRAQLQGALPDDEAVVHIRGAYCRIFDCGRRSLTADGEPAGELPADFTLVAGVLRVIVPASRGDENEAGDV